MDLTKNRLNYIYVLMRKDIPFYVGKTHYPKRRETEHKLTYGSDIKMMIIKAIKNEEWKKHEQEWINIFKRWGVKLTNSNPGGGGPLKGIKRSKEFGEKISKSKKGKKRNPQEVTNATLSKQKPVNQYDKEGNLINSFPSAKLAANYIGIHHNNMYDHLKGKYKTAKGYIFKYDNK